MGHHFNIQGDHKGCKSYTNDPSSTPKPMKRAIDLLGKLLLERNGLSVHGNIKYAHTKGE